MNNIKAAPDGTPERRPSGKRRAHKPVVAQLDTHIGKELRELYASILDEPIPDRFLSLIQSFQDHNEPEGGNPKPTGSRTEGNEP